MHVYPLNFRPIFKPRVWGGRRLEAVLGKPLPPEGLFGESWEVADLDSEQSVVCNGPAAGKALTELRTSWGEELTGHAPLSDGRLPLLIKFLDARETLSVQVHPDEESARMLGPGARPKHEAWYVIEARPGAFIYRGLKPGVDAAALTQAVRDGQVEHLLNRVPARKGHCYFSPGGMVHAIGAGVLAAEIQTPSDTTYRLYDWDRPDPATGRPRELHVEQALACMRYDLDPASAERLEHLGSVWTSVTSLIRCPAFVIERVRMAEGVEQEIPHQEMIVWIVLEGRGSIVHASAGSPTEFGIGDTVLIPAGLKQGRVQARSACMWLEVTVPVPSSLAGFDRPQPGTRFEPLSGGERLVDLKLPPRP